MQIPAQPHFFLGKWEVSAMSYWNMCIHKWEVTLKRSLRALHSSPALVMDIQSSSMDTDFILLCSLSRWPYAALVTLRSGLWGRPVHDWLCSTLCFSIYVGFYCSDYVFEIIAMLVDQNPTVLFCVHNYINFNKIPNDTDWNIAPNHDRASTVVQRWL